MVLHHSRPSPSQPPPAAPSADVCDPLLERALSGRISFAELLALSVYVDAQAERAAKREVRS